LISWDEGPLAGAVFLDLALQSLDRLPGGKRLPRVEDAGEEGSIHDALRVEDDEGCVRAGRHDYSMATIPTPSYGRER
jgi:hypothetical protein